MGRRVRRGVRAALIALIVAGPAATSLAAQQPTIEPPPPSGPPPGEDWPDWVGQFTVLSGNALVSGLTAGLIHWLRHDGDFADAFVRGAAGGAVVYAGKRITVERFDGAGFLGREVAAVGTSLVHNASAGRAALDRLLLPAGPVHVILDRRARGGYDVRARLDLIATGTLVWAATQDELEFDGHASLSAGAPVFRAPGLLFDPVGGDLDRSTGVTIAGTILLSDIPRFGQSYLDRVYAHERLHVLHTDYFSGAWGEPMEEWLEERYDWLGGPRRRVTLGLGEPILGSLGWLIGAHDERPWEMEANFLEGR